MPTSPISPWPSHGPEPAGPAPVPSHGPGGRPVAPVWPGPSPVRDLTGLSAAERASVHRANVRVREADASAYAEYLDAYLEGARRCRTAGQLRAYGRPAPPSAGLEPGGSIAEQRDLDIAGVFGRQVHASSEAHRELGELILRLERRPVPLDVFFDAALTARVEVGGRAAGGTLSARGGAAPLAGAGPVTVQPGRVDARLCAGVLGAKVAIAGGELRSVELSAPALPGVRGFARLSRGAVEEGVVAGGAVGGREGAPAVRVEARASVGVNLVTPEVVRWALSSRSWWDGER